MDNYLSLKVGEHIDYKRPIEDKLTIGKIVKFQQTPNSDSVWMLVSEIENNKNRDWIPCDVWKEQKDSGLFENKLQTKIELPNVDSNESLDKKLPF